MSLQQLARNKRLRAGPAGLGKTAPREVFQFSLDGSRRNRVLVHCLVVNGGHRTSRMLVTRTLSDLSAPVSLGPIRLRFQSIPE